MYEHILLSTELLNESKVIEDRAVALHKLIGAKLSIIHIVEPMPMMYAVGESAIAYDFQDTTDALIKQANEKLSALKLQYDIPNAEIIIKHGYIGDEILTFANKNNIDLIITGSHGRHGVRLLLGSTANAILHGAKCDVMAVRIKDD